MAYVLPRISVEGHGPCLWTFAFSLQDLTSWAHLPFLRFLGPCMQGPLAFTNCFDWSQGVWPHLFRNFSEEGKKSQMPCFPFFSLKCSILLLLKKKAIRLLDVEGTSCPGTFAAYKGYTFIQRNGSNKVLRSLKAETSAGTLCRLLAEFSIVK